MTKKGFYATLEIVLILSAAFWVTWSVKPGQDSYIERHRTEILFLFACAFLYLAYISPCLLFKDSLSDRGIGTLHTFFIRTDNFRDAACGYGTITIGGSLLIIGATLLHQPDVFTSLNWKAFFLKLSFYISSGFAQQMLAVGWLCVRLRHIFPENDRRHARHTQLASSFTVALIALFFHLPNLPLMGISLVAGFALCWVSYTTPNLFLAGCAHAILGTELTRIAGLNVRIGPYYLQQDFHFFRTLFPFTKTLIGNLF